MNVEESHYFLNNGSLWYIDYDKSELSWCEYEKNLDDPSIYVRE